MHEAKRPGMAPGKRRPQAGSAGERTASAARRVRAGTGRGHGAGWIWGDPADGIPADAPLHALLLAASRVMGAYYASTLVQAGLRISPAGLGVLRVLLAGDGLKSSDVAARGWSSPGTLTSVVNTLVREGYVERRRDPGDRRVVRLYVTGKGRRICEDYLLAGRTAVAGRVRLREPGRRAGHPQVLHRHDRSVQRADQEGARPVTRDAGCTWHRKRGCQHKLT